MTIAAAVGTVPMPLPEDARRWVATARWARRRWAVSITDGRGATCAAPNAERLVEVVARARQADDMAHDIDLRVQLGPRLASAYRDARDRHHAAAILRRAGLDAEDVDIIVLSRLLSLAGLAANARIPGDPWAAFQ